MIEIEKGIPLPKPKSSPSCSKYPFPLMEVGDSFFIDGDPGSTQRVRSAVTQYQRRTPGTKFSVRVVEGGCRVWRVE